MPVIRIDFDKTKISDNDIQSLSKAVQKIVAEITNIEDTPVYAFSPAFSVKIAPIEIYVQLSAQKIDLDELHAKMVARVSEWKKAVNFPHPINFTLIPMQWKFEIEI